MKCQCGKEIKGDYKLCYDCNLKKATDKSKVTSLPKEEAAKPIAASSIGLSTEERILKGQCLNIAANMLQGNATKEQLIDYAEDLYSKIKKRGYL